MCTKTRRKPAGTADQQAARRWHDAGPVDTATFGPLTCPPSSRRRLRSPSRERASKPAARAGARAGRHLGGETVAAHDPVHRHGGQAERALAAVAVAAQEQRLLIELSQHRRRAEAL